ncbi:MAG: tetratricopeptide repeat protein [Chitinophagaceae bacterium]|nr:MAG: tetratricopeptide repeat protein [Chitinophagaceae bacterium]
MKKLLCFVALCASMALSFPAAAQNADDLSTYIAHLRADHAGDRKETGFLSAGLDFLYGQDYFDAKNYASAADYFKDVLKKEPDNAYANYQVALSLIRQNDKYKTEQAQPYLQRAFQINPSLVERYRRDTGAAAPAAPAAPAAQPRDQQAAPANAANSSLESYIESLKRSRATGGAETAMNTPGREALYGIEYYEKNDYLGAETDLKSSLSKDPANPYVNYLLAVSLTALGKKAEAAPYLQKAVAGAPELRNRFARDAAGAIQKWNQHKAAPPAGGRPAAPAQAGGPLVYGKYTCTQTVYNGAGASPAYSYNYKGYFELKADGTYRWLDNGGSGRYKYDAATGSITWLSGYFKNVAPQSTRYQVNKTTVQTTVNFTNSYRWECGCNKK